MKPILSAVLTRMMLIFSPTGLNDWNVDVSSLAFSARSPHSVSAGNASPPSLTTSDHDGTELEAMEASLRLLAVFAPISA